MARLLFQKNDPWFDELKVVSSYTEKELERMILEHVDTVFPKYNTISFNKTLRVAGSTTGRNPDLAIISKDYSEWWIVEIETYEDDKKHVMSQIKVFTEFEYNNFSIANYIYQKNTVEFELPKLVKMVNDVKPQVLVMIDDIDENFKSEIESLGALTCVFQVYRNKDGTHAFRLHGDYPKLFESVSNCTFVKYPAHTLEVHEADWFIDGVVKMISKANKNLHSRHRRVRNRSEGKFQKKTINDVELDIDFNGRIGKWKILLESNRIFLKSVGFHSLPVINTYSLSADYSFKLYLKINS